MHIFILYFHFQGKVVPFFVIEGMANISCVFVVIYFNRFERSDTFRFEVPRMLFEDTAQLESYVLKSKDRYEYLQFNVCYMLVILLFIYPRFLC